MYELQEHSHGEESTFQDRFQVFPRTQSRKRFRISKMINNLPFYSESELKYPPMINETRKRKSGIPTFL